MCAELSLRSRVRGGKNANAATLLLAGRGFRGRRDGVEDPGAAVALGERLVAPDFVEHLRTKADVALGAQAVARFGQGNAPAMPCDVLEQVECRFGNLGG